MSFYFLKSFPSRPAFYCFWFCSQNAFILAAFLLSRKIVFSLCVFSSATPSINLITFLTHFYRRSNGHCAVLESFSSFLLELELEIFGMCFCCLLMCGKRTRMISNHSTKLCYGCSQNVEMSTWQNRTFLSIFRVITFWRLNVYF